LQVLLVIYGLEKCDLILMSLTNLDRFELVAFVVIQIACWPIEGGGDVDYCVGSGGI
jgi:hypothetical protein